MRPFSASAIFVSDQLWEAENVVIEDYEDLVYEWYETK
ncbi:hypothetical protein M7I_3573 [Glarea lozoyensis 74030]|uniref:Uncharacterized protein n=1 Tax=Glarea lozoyensis (strain ATCC 74030 / MF5533) TaxID=1104152 RepID=H0ELV1_GLAL7|nr:hypothetical protein M7I_3573 [Glarea lozoyensis 74030]